MKKIVLFLSLFLTLQSCDDGDLIQKTFDFDNVSVSPGCNELVYKVSKNEAMLLQVSPSLFLNEVTPIDQPRTTTIDNNSQKVFYRSYSSEVTPAYICAIVTPATPIVTDEYLATGGTMEVTTTENKDEKTGLLLGYNHTIFFKNITFQGKNNTIVYDDYRFGVYFVPKS